MTFDPFNAFDTFGGGVVQSIADRYRASVMEDSPAAYWRLGESSGTAAADEAVSNPGVFLPNTGGAWTGGSQGVSGPFAGSGAAAFNGATGRVEVADHAALRPTAVSIEAWWHKAGSPSTGYIVGKRDNSVQNWGLFHNPDGTLTMFGGVAVPNIMSPALANGWNHIVGIINSAGIAEIYVNAVLVASGTVTAPNTSSTPSLIMGARRSTGSGVAALSNQTLCEIAIYPTVLPAGRIAAHYAAAGY